MASMSVGRKKGERREVVVVELREGRGGSPRLRPWSMRLYTCRVPETVAATARQLSTSNNPGARSLQRKGALSPRAPGESGNKREGESKRESICGLPGRLDRLIRSRYLINSADRSSRLILVQYKYAR